MGQARTADRTHSLRFERQVCKIYVRFGSSYMLFAGPEESKWGSVKQYLSMSGKSIPCVFSLRMDIRLKSTRASTPPKAKPVAQTSQDTNPAPAANHHPSLYPPPHPAPPTNPSRPTPIPTHIPMSFTQPSSPVSPPVPDSDSDPPLLRLPSSGTTRKSSPPSSAPRSTAVDPPLAGVACARRGYPFRGASFRGGG